MKFETVVSRRYGDEYRERGYWKDLTAADLVKRNVAAQYPAREALVDPRTRVTFEEVKLLVDRIALGMLEAGLKKDDVIGLFIPPRVETTLLSWAVNRIGAILLQLPLSYRTRELLPTLQASHCAALICYGEHAGFDYVKLVREAQKLLPDLQRVWVLGGEPREGTRELSELSGVPWEQKRSPEELDAIAIHPDEVMTILLSGGTTGSPKLAIHSHNSFLSFADTLGRLTPGSSARDTMLNLTPTGGGMGTAGSAYLPLAIGCKLVQLDDYSPDTVFRTVEKERITHIHALPPTALRLLAEEHLDKYDLSSLTVMFTGGAPMPPAAMRQAEQRLGCFLVSTYGATDAGFAAGLSIYDPKDKRYTTAGTPRNLPGTRTVILDDQGRPLPSGQLGVIGSSSPGTFLGYMGVDPEETKKVFTEDGYCVSMRDVGWLDHDGYLILVGRNDDMINRGGQKIAPKEIADLAVTHPLVIDAACAGIPDPELGERIALFIVPSPGATPTLEDVRVFLADKGLDKHKLPEYLDVRETIRNEGGKISVKQLRDDYLAKKGASRPS